MLPHLLLPMGVMTTIPELAVTVRHKVLAELSLELLPVDDGSRPTGHETGIGLHLAKSDGVVGHKRPLITREHLVPILARGAVDAKALLVENARGVVVGDGVLLGTVLYSTFATLGWSHAEPLAPVAILTLGHLGEIKLVEVHAMLPIHTPPIQPVMTHNSPVPRINSTSLHLPQRQPNPPRLELLLLLLLLLLVLRKYRLANDPLVLARPALVIRGGPPEAEDVLEDATLLREAGADRLDRSLHLRGIHVRLKRQGVPGGGVRRALGER